MLVVHMLRVVYLRVGRCCGEGHVREWVMENLSRFGTTLSCLA